ncbi:MAG: hypothetical protein IPM57_01545 [Oligoflexia bacterium]|nr:hypothetical protein [Oligoflexia bacterium]
MKVINLFDRFLKLQSNSKTEPLDRILRKDEDLEQLLKLASQWDLDLENVQRWLLSEPYQENKKVALEFCEGLEKEVKKIEKVLNTSLSGEICICPSLMIFDGFARYDSGNHRVWFGVDYPGASQDYLKVLLAHELSHVYRDHQPNVWGFLGKPLNQVTRNEYIDNLSATEHLASEGLATLFSQVIYPEIPLSVHHYYEEHEMKWCFDNLSIIEKAILEELLSEGQDVWKFYDEDIIKPGSPGRTQYFWSALKIRNWLDKKLTISNRNDNYLKVLIDCHGKSALEFDCFTSE